MIEMDMAFIPSAENISVVKGKLHGVIADILEIFVVADINPGTERCALRLWHPDFDNDNFGQIPMGGDELRENSIISLRIRADEALRISVVCKLQKTELRRGAFLSEVVLREAAGGRFLLKTGFPTGASTALPAYLLSEVFFAGRSPDDE